MPRLPPSVADAVRPATSGRWPGTWVLLVVAIPFLVLQYQLLPVEGIPRIVMYPLYGILAFAIILVAVHYRAPIRRGSWRLIALGLALLSVGDVAYSILALNVVEVPYPSVSDIAYLSGYVALVAGFVGLIRGRAPGGDRMPIIDAAILAAGAGAFFWVAIMEPSLSGATDTLAMLVSVGYPAMDLVLFSIGLRSLLGSEARPRYLPILLSGIAVYFVADVVYAMAVLDGTYALGLPVDAGWIVGVLMMSAAALHPSVADPVMPIVASETSLSRSRLAVLAIAAMLAPGILLFRGSAADQDVVIGLVVSWTVLFGLVLIRLATTVDELGVSLLQRRRLQDDLAYQATHDPLTRLANRALFEGRLHSALAADAPGTAVIFVDLDDFKTINDTLGHAIGDELLQTIAARVQRELRGNDLAARLGGDEFAVLLEQCPDESTAHALAERLLAVIRAPVALAGRRMSAHASAGIALGRPGATGMDLMRDADVAMYQAKSHGKDQVEQHRPAMHEAIVRSYQLRTELAAAIETESFILEYQPTLEIETGRITGAEALVRWRHPERGIIPPAEFIGIAESSGLIHALGRWILREACTTAAVWPARPNGEGLTISVNLAPSQLLQPRLVDDVADVLRDTGLEPGRLVLEVTESALTDLDASRKALDRLRELGVRLALDDFGTGYSALNYLAELPFGIVKIDRSFVVAMEDSERVEALLDGILGLCRSLGLSAIAEGVETEPQLARLRRLGCRYGQGYLFARPMPAAAFEEFLDSAPVVPLALRARPQVQATLVSAG